MRSSKPTIAALAIGSILVGALAGSSPAAPGDVTVTASQIAEISAVGDSSPVQFTAIGSTVFFVAGDGTGSEVYKTEPPYSSATLVEDINPIPSGQEPAFLTAIGSTLLFRASGDPTATAHELWKSEPPYNAASTSMVEDIKPGGGINGGSEPSEFKNMNGTLYFAANDGTNGNELWRSDPPFTAATTTMVANIRPLGLGSSPQEFTLSGGTIFFNANNGTDGEELWKTDGTEANTIQVQNIHPSDGSSPFELTDAGGTLYFSAEDGTDQELWKSNGTGATEIDINPSGSSSPEDLTNFNGTVFFSADDGTNGVELWKSGGGPVGTNPGDTQMVADIAPGSEDSFPDGMADFNGTLFFQAADAGSATPHGTELWKSSGAGASLVADIRPGTAGSNPFPFINVNGTLLFTADDGVHGDELWQSNGATAGTKLAADVLPGAGAAQPEELASHNGILFFVPSLPGSGREPWKATLSVEGPAPVVSPPAPPKKKCKKGRKLKKGKCVKKKRKKK